MERRVVITGLGAVTPIGNDVDTFWENLKAGKCGITKITKFDSTDFKAHVAAEVKDFDPLLYMDKGEVRKNDPFSQFAIAAATQAWGALGAGLRVRITRISWLAPTANCMMGGLTSTSLLGASTNSSVSLCVHL